jgi:hypothetical protein
MFPMTREDYRKLWREILTHAERSMRLTAHASSTRSDNLLLVRMVIERFDALDLDVVLADNGNDLFKTVKGFPVLDVLMLGLEKGVSEGAPLLPPLDERKKECLEHIERVKDVEPSASDVETVFKIVQEGSRRVMVGVSETVSVSIYDCVFDESGCCKITEPGEKLLLFGVFVMDVCVSLLRLGAWKNIESLGSDQLLESIYRRVFGDLYDQGIEDALTDNVRELYMAMSQDLGERTRSLAERLRDLVPQGG